MQGIFPHELRQFLTLKICCCSFRDLADQLGVEVADQSYDSPHTKTLLLLHAHMSRAALPCSDYFTDTKSVLDQALRILQVRCGLHSLPSVKFLLHFFHFCCWHCVLPNSIWRYVMAFLVLPWTSVVSLRKRQWSSDSFESLQMHTSTPDISLHLS